MKKFAFSLLALCLTPILLLCLLGAFIGRHARDTGIRMCNWLEPRV